MTLNYPDQINYIVKAVGVQNIVVDAIKSPNGFLGLYGLIMIISLFIWARRITEKEEVFHFVVWMFLVSAINYATFVGKQDMPLDIQQWIPNVQGLTLTYTTTTTDNKPVNQTIIKGAPGIDAFFSSATDFVNLAAVTMINGMGTTINNSVFVKDQSCASVESVFTDAYLQYIRDIGTGNTRYGSKTDPSTVVDFTGKDLPQCSGYRATERNVTITTTDSKTGSIISTEAVGKIPICDEFWQRYQSKAQACISKQMDPAGSLKASLTNQFEQPEIVKGIKTLNTAVNGGGLADAAFTLTYGVGSDNVIAKSIRFIDYGLAKLGAEMQPELQKRTISLLVVQVVVMGFLIALSPFFIVWSFIPLGGSVINYRFLFKYLAAFAFTVAWYPMLLFAKAFLYGSFIN